jgi:pimeloyl-ACP methyl ester carboxylesterase
MKRKLIWTGSVILSLYIILCTTVYFFQEKLIFHPTKLDKNYAFTFEDKFEEVNYKTADGSEINTILFKADSTRGLVFYLHGNSGSLQSWGKYAKPFLDLNYDVLMMDYRTFGKSVGALKGERIFFSDIKQVYDSMLTHYPENQIVVTGYSVGTGPAAWLASTNNPKLLLLHAPYFSLSDMAKKTYPFLPGMILNYNFETWKYIDKCKMSVVIFHGDQDETIYYESSLKLKEHFKQGDTLITLPGQKHNEISENPVYLQVLKKFLK